jgi:hypothetical protein
LSLSQWLNDDYTTVMELSPSGSTVSYPDLDCSGRLVAAGVDGSHAVYREFIDHGACTSGGRWSVRVLSESTISARWEQAGVSYQVTARLVR